MDRLVCSVKNVISHVQTAYMKGGNIMDGVVILHENLNTINVNKLSAILFKGDFEKAYHNIKSPFVYKMLKLKGYSDLWIDWIMSTTSGGHVGIIKMRLLGLNVLLIRV
jgi:hypothetical protein